MNEWKAVMEIRKERKLQGNLHRESDKLTHFEIDCISMLEDVDANRARRASCITRPSGVADLKRQRRRNAGRSFPGLIDQKNAAQ